MKVTKRMFEHTDFSSSCADDTQSGLMKSKGTTDVIFIVRHAEVLSYRQYSAIFAA